MWVESILVEGTDTAAATAAAPDQVGQNKMKAGAKHGKDKPDDEEDEGDRDKGEPRRHQTITQEPTEQIANKDEAAERAQKQGKAG